jgi:hypothetical protein
MKSRSCSPCSHPCSCRRYAPAAVRKRTPSRAVHFRSPTLPSVLAPGRPGIRSSTRRRALDGTVNNSTTANALHVPARRGVVILGSTRWWDEGREASRDLEPAYGSQGGSIPRTRPSSSRSAREHAGKSDVVSRLPSRAGQRTVEDPDEHLPRVALIVVSGRGLRGSALPPTPAGAAQLRCRVPGTIGLTPGRPGRFVTTPPWGTAGT